MIDFYIILGIKNCILNIILLQYKIQMIMQQDYKNNKAINLQILEKRFNEIKNEENRIKGSLVLSTLKPFFKTMPDTDFQAVFATYVVDFNLNEQHKTIALEQLKFIYLGIQDQLNKIKKHPPFGIFCFSSHYSLRRSQLQQISITSLTKQPIFQIFTKKLTDIVPYEIIFFDSLYRQDKTPQKLTEQTLQQPYYCYDFKIYENLLQNYQGPLMNKLVRFFYEVIDFRWIESLNFLKKELLTDSNIKQSSYMIPIFENLKHIQQQIYNDPNVNTLKPLFQKRKMPQFPKIDNLNAQTLKKINEYRNIFGLVCTYCANIYKQLQNPYLRATCYFLGKKFQSEPKFQEICNNQKLGIMIRFLFARRFLAPNQFNKFYQKVLTQSKINPKLQHIMFLKNKTEVIQTLQKYWDNNPNQLERIALTCGIVLHKYGKGFNKDHQFLQKMVKTYEELLRIMNNKQIQKEYMLKMMTVRSSKQSIMEDLIVKPQFRLYCQPRNDDCVFLSMMEKFVKNRDQKWMKLKSRGNMANDTSKKHYEVEVTNCPYCNYPTPRCSICLEHIKIFTVKSYVNQQIKSKRQKQQKPYMKLSQPLEQALIWCPSCGHGGHFGHLEQWFKQNKGCPVDQCQCKCKY